MKRSVLIWTVVLPVFGIFAAGCPNEGHQAGDVAIFAGIEFVWCPSGVFWMGQEESTLSAGIVETPRHLVVFDTGFWMSKYEITQKQWQDVTGSNPSTFKSENRPVEMVSWLDAQTFIAVLNTENPGEHFRLPSEAEWEYACRAGSNTRFYWGDDPTYADVPNHAWFHDNSDLVTHDVGGKLPNAWGLHDMSGNVWEWTQDWWHDDYEGAPSDGSAWVTEVPGLSHNRVLRGAAYNYENYHCQSACRGIYPLDGKSSSYGFRLAKF
jgi:formylglycine-generating enzyme required for sulfatase activity